MCTPHGREASPCCQAWGEPQGLPVCTGVRTAWSLRSLIALGSLRAAHQFFVGFDVHHDYAFSPFEQKQRPAFSSSVKQRPWVLPERWIFYDIAYIDLSHWLPPYVIDLLTPNSEPNLHPKSTSNSHPKPTLHPNI